MPCQQCTSMGRLWDVTYVYGTSMGRKTKKNVCWVACFHVYYYNKNRLPIFLL